MHLGMENIGNFLKPFFLWDRHVKKKLYRQKCHASAVLTMIGLARNDVVLQPPFPYSPV